MPGRTAIPLAIPVRSPRWRRRRRVPAALPALRMVMIALVGLAALAVVLAAVTRPGLVVHLDRALVALGFGVEKASVRGSVHTTDAAVREALALDGGRSHILLDLARMKARVEALPWVLTANIARLLPDAIAVEVTERKPSAVWRTVDHDVLVDGAGRLLGNVARGSVTGLMQVTGVDAGAAVPELQALLADNSEIAARFVEARRVAARRWSLLLTSGTLVHLPADGVEAAIAWLDAQASSGLLERGLETIDLRVADQIVVRPAHRGAAPQSSASALGGSKGRSP